MAEHDNRFDAGTVRFRSLFYLIIISIFCAQLSITGIRGQH